MSIEAENLRTHTKMFFTNMTSVKTLNLIFFLHFIYPMKLCKTLLFI